jgi:hypothetical protein
LGGAAVTISIFIQEGVPIMVTMKNARWIAGLLAAMAVGVSAPADAASNNGKTVATVNVNVNNGQSQLIVTLSDSTAYYANVGVGCGAAAAPPFDLVKMWESQVTAALLAGKKVNINYTLCNTYNFITSVDLVQ